MFVFMLRNAALKVSKFASNQSAEPAMGCSVSPESLQIKTFVHHITMQFKLFQFLAWDLVFCIVFTATEIFLHF